MHRLLASLPPLLRERGVPHQLIVTTNYDLGLERAFEEAEEELDVVAYVASGPNQGRFWHRPPGEPPRPGGGAERVHRALARRAQCPPQASRRRRPSSGARVGELRRDRGRPHRVPRPLRARDCGSGHARCPVAPQPLPLRRLRDGRLEPAARAQPGLGRATVVYGSWAAQPSPSALERAFWRHYDVDVLDIEPDALVALLDARARAAAQRERTRDRAVSRPQLVRRDRARRTPVLRARGATSRSSSPISSPPGSPCSTAQAASASRRCSARASRGRCASSRSSRWSSCSPAGVTIRRVVLADAVSTAAGLTSGDGLVETVRRAAADRDVYLILDQAEEYFLYHPANRRLRAGAGRARDRAAAGRRAPLDPRGRARQARPVQGADPEHPRQLPAPRSPRPSCGRAGDRRPARAPAVARRPNGSRSSRLLVERVLDEVAVGRITPGGAEPEPAPPTGRRGSRRRSSSS